MTKEEIKEETSEEETKVETEEETKEEEATSTSDENSEEDTPKENEEETPKDIDYKKELEELEANKPEKRSEKEKAEFTIKKIHERFPDLKTDEAKPDDEGLVKVEQNLLRQQVEGIIRTNSKSEDEVKFKMFHYDNKIVKSGNIHEDSDNAMWLANKGRTKNAIEELKRKPETGKGGGTGQKTPTSGITPLSNQDLLQMKQLGLKQTAPDKWEGEKVQLIFNKQTKKWEQSRK